MLEDTAVGPPVADVVETEVDGCVALFLPATHHAAVLNETASDIWRLCDGEHGLAEIVRLLAAAYGVAPGDIEEEVVSTVTRLRSDGFLADGS